MARCSGVIATPILLVNAFSPAIFALLVDRFGWQTSLYALLGCSIVTWIAIELMSRWYEGAQQFMRPLRSRMLWSTSWAACFLLAQEPLRRRHRRVDGGGAHLVERLRLGPGDLLLGQLGSALEHVLERDPRLVRQGLASRG